MADELTRRAFLNAWMAAPLVLTGAMPALAQDRELALTPACGPDDEPTPPQTEGPFYTSGTPRKRDFRADGAGQSVSIFGHVVDQACNPQGGVLVDLWHADGDGAYDNAGYRFRGHQITDEGGRFVFETIVPGLYTGRTRHFHVKLAGARAALTTQLYFPGEAGNTRDGLFDPSLVMNLSQASDGLLARFDFVVAG